MDIAAKSRTLLVAAALALGACAGPSISPQARNDLAPGGTVRVAVNYGNPVLARRDAATGHVSGITVDLALALGRRIDATVQIVPYDTVAKLLAGLRAGDWDVGFLAVDPARAPEVEFTAPYMEVEVSYLVPASSGLRSVGDVDRAGVRVAVQERNAADLFLSRNLKQATLLRTPNLAAAFAALKSGDAQAFAANRQELSSLMASNPGYRTVDGRFSTIPHAAAVPAGRHAAAEYLRAFIEEEKANGAVKRAIEESGVRGVVVAPRAAR
jgi:polar amino acid transport system substrate-binding protein